MFGKKTGRTVLLLDIESGSVATALLTVSAQGPHLFGYRRLHTPTALARTPEQLFSSIDKTLGQSLLYAAEVAARMRVHNQEALGTVEHVAVFLAAPWGMPNLEAGKPEFDHGIMAHVKNAIASFFGTTKTSFHTSADALAFSARMFNTDPNVVLAALRGECMELLLMLNSKVHAYGTVPSGVGSIVRTLKAHGHLSEHEARSRLTLLKHDPEHAYEPLIASGEHLGKEFARGVSLLLEHGTPQGVVVVGDGALSEWFARRLSEEETLSELFPQEATVEALKQHFFAPPLSVSAVQDPFILTQASFINERARL